MAAGHRGSSWVVYDDLFWAGMFEEIDQQVDILNAGSRNALRIVTQRSKGDFQKESFVDDMTIVGERNIASVSAKTDTPMTMGEHIRPKVNRIIGPIGQTIDSWKKLGSNEQEMSLIVGRMTGAKVVQDYVNTAILAITAAIGQETLMVEDDTAAIVTSDGLRDSLARMGDQSSDVLVWVMHSKVFYDLMKDQTGTYTSLDTVAGVVLQSASPASYGRPIVVTDSPALVTSGTPNTYHTLGLKANAVVVMESEERNLVSEIVTGLDNLVFRIQGEYAYNLSLRGFSYTHATYNPADSALATGGNWTTVMAPKLGAGVLLNTQ